MEDEWVVAREWTLATTALRQRALMLEALLPFAGAPPATVLRVVTTVQKHARGMAGRSAAKTRRKLKAMLCDWAVYAHRARRAWLLQRHAVRESCAALIQKKFRAYLARWTRPKVSELLLRLKALEERDVFRKKSWRKKGRVTRACQTNL